MGRTRILFTSSFDAPFISDDVHLLSAHFDVQRLTTRGPLSLLGVLPGMMASDCSYTWFASTYAYWVVTLASILGKPSVIVVGGVDASKMPEIGYGIWLRRWKASLVGRAVRKASRVLVVAPSLKDQIVRLAVFEGRNVIWVPTGYDSTFWTPSGAKEQVILTVAACDDLPRLRAKGIDFLLRCARELPQTAFVVVGVHERIRLRANLPELPNVRFLPYASREELRRLYRVAKVYFLPSLTEGMPNSLCEAMLCGCVPVASDVGGVPEVLGDTGIRVRYGDVSGTARALSRALASAESAAEQARSRVVRTFPIERRERELLSIFSEVLA